MASAKINALLGVDRSDLFDLICSQVALIKPSEAKKKFLGIDGAPREIEDYIPDMNDIMKMVEIFELESVFQINYTNLRIDNDQKYFDALTHKEEADAGLLVKEKLCDTHKKMKAQAEEIKDPELKVVDNTEVKDDQETTLDMTKWPDPPDFL